MESVSIDSRKKLWKGTIIMKNNFLKMNIQLFAEPSESDNPKSTSQGAEQSAAFNLEELTDEQLASIKEKHGFKTDDDVNTIIKSKHQRWQKDLEKEKNQTE